VHWRFSASSSSSKIATSESYAVSDGGINGRSVLTPELTSILSFAHPVKLASDNRRHGTITVQVFTDFIFHLV